MSPAPLAKPPGTGIAVFTHRNQILLGFSGSREAAEVVAGGGGGDRGCDRYKDEDFV